MIINRDLQGDDLGAKIQCYTMQKERSA